MSEEIIPFHRPYPLTHRDKEYILTFIYNVLDSGQLTNGKYVRLLEDKIKELYKVKYCIATSNASMGLYLCYLYFWSLRPLHMPSFTWFSPHLLFDKNNMIQLHDIDLKTWLMKDNYYSGFIMPTHTFGNTIEMKRVHNNKVVYDGAHSLGCKLNDIGNATVFSLAATKIITSCEGGLVITNNKELADFVSNNRDKSCRMSEVHAIIGLQTLRYLPKVLEWKKNVFDYYCHSIPGQFQEVPIESNYNTIGFLNTEKLLIPETFEIKQYYQPIQGRILHNAFDVYRKMVCLPSFMGVDYKKIVEDILEGNGL